MRSRRLTLTLGLGVSILIAFAFFTTSQAQQPAVDVAIDPDDIGGVVSGPKGPEAGVWVIAETRDLPVRYIKSVVTDDRGRFVVPDLPAANYTVWARGYGLVDSDKTTTKPGQRLSIAAKVAPNEAAAAHYYPAIYWYSMLKIPAADQFDGKNIPPLISQVRWLGSMKNLGCVGCHQLGQESTRTIPKSLGTFATGADAWKRRVQSGQAGQMMYSQLTALGETAFANFGDWTDRVAKGELPFAKPPRPEGVERNIVVTLRDWMNEKQYLHDLIASDRRYPTVNAYGPLIGSPEYSSDMLPLLDPVKNTATTFKAPVRDPAMPLNLGPGHAAGLDALQPSPYWGNERIWETRVNNHNSMFGRDGRVWLAASVRGADNPAWCKAGSDHPSAKLTPKDRAVRHIAVLDPKTMKYTFVETCYSTHHVQFGYDANDTLWSSGGGDVVGWLNTKMFDATGDAAKSQGWTALIFDTNGNGKRDDYVELKESPAPGKDTRIVAPFYAVMPSPADGSVWGSVMSVPGGLVRLAPGTNPPETALAEIYNVPLPGFGARGADIDSNGVVWVSLASGHMGRFDRRRCKGPLNGPAATLGNHCPEGWSFHKYPGPGFQSQGVGDNSAESSYYSWVDQHNTFGLGNDVPMSTGNLNDGLIAYANGRMVVLRVPYPMGFYAKGFDGRIDDPKAGWKGRGIWAANGDRTPWLIEGGKGTKPLAAHFQLRPDPLAK